MSHMEMETEMEIDGLPAVVGSYIHIHSVASILGKLETMET